MQAVRWGVLSTARIGIQKVLPGMQKSDCCDIRAIASRSLQSAQNAARQLGIEKAYGSYQELLDDPEIEAIYNPLPNHLHVPLTLQAAQNGKHVLCEKPIAITAREAEQLREVADKVLIAEAFMVRFHPQWERVRDWVKAGRIGEVRALQAFFSYFNDNPRDIRNQADIGGGGALDIGCYPIVCGRFLFGAEPQRVIALIDRDPDFSTDRTTSALLDFGAGRQLGFTVSTQCVPYQRVQICGTKGRIEVKIPFNAPQGEPAQLFLDDGSSLEGNAIQTEIIAASDQYMLQGEVFSKAVRGEAALAYGVEDAIQNMRILDAIFRSESSGQWEIP